MFEPSISLARVTPVDQPSLPLSFVVVPTDRGNRFALEGPDPAHHNAWTRQPLSYEQVKNVNSLFAPRDTKAKVDLLALALLAETWRFVWTVARHETNEGSVDLSHHASLASARRRFEQLQSAIRQDREQTWPVSHRDVVASVHRVEN
jgi:hypothetical protein